MSPALHVLGTILSLMTAGKSFADNPLLGSSRLNRLGLHIARKRAAHAMCQVRRKLMASRVPKTWREAYQRNGFVTVQDFLPPQIFENVQRELTKLTQLAIEMRQGPTLTRRFNLDASNCKDLPSLQALLKHTDLMWGLRYAAGYWGQPIIAVQCIHVDEPDSALAHDPQTEWHSDTFHSTAKAWIFLHEVGGNGGPLAYIPGSHQPTKRRLAWEKKQSIHASAHTNRLHARGSFRASSEEIRDLGGGEPMRASVAKNTLVIADTSGFHRRTPSLTSTIRVEIYMSLRRNPFWAGLLPSFLGLPFIKNHWAGLAWRFYRWMNEHRIPSWRASTQQGLTAIEIDTIFPRGKSAHRGHPNTL